MNLLKEVLKHEVYPAVGCTEPIACAYCAAVAAHELGEPVLSLCLTVDPATYKNGACVLVPNTGGRTGNPIAASLGALIAKPEKKLQVLEVASAELIEQAAQMKARGRVEYRCRTGYAGLSLEVTVQGVNHTARCLIAGGHTRIREIERDGQFTFRSQDDAGQPDLSYRKALRAMPLTQIITLAELLDDDDRQLLREGITLNLAMSEKGYETKGTAFQLRHLQNKGLVKDDLFQRVQLMTASACDARMAGLPYPVMTSGGSGNQGIVAILAPFAAAKSTGVDDETMLRSIAVSHLVNAYVKCYLGELSAICGCALAAGIGAAVAIVYQRIGNDSPKITKAINNVIGDLGGMVCDGAKPGCALKVMTSVDSALRSALMALEGFGLTEEQGMLGATAEESLRQLSRLSREGMIQVDATMLSIIEDREDPDRD